MATRNAPRKTASPVLTNREIALDLTKAALQGGIPSSLCEPTADPMEITRQHAIYASRLFHFLERRLDARDARDAAEKTT